MARCRSTSRGWSGSSWTPRRTCRLGASMPGIRPPAGRQRWPPLGTRAVASRCPWSGTVGRPGDSPRGAQGAPRSTSSIWTPAATPSSAPAGSAHPSTSVPTWSGARSAVVFTASRRSMRTPCSRRHSPTSCPLLGRSAIWPARRSIWRGATRITRASPYGDSVRGASNVSPPWTAATISSSFNSRETSCSGTRARRPPYSI